MSGKLHLDKPTSVADFENLASTAIGVRDPAELVLSTTLPGTAVSTSIIFSDVDVTAKNKAEILPGWSVLRRNLSPQTSPPRDWQQKITVAVARSLSVQKEKLRIKESILEQKIASVDRVLSHPLIHLLLGLGGSRAVAVTDGVEISAPSASTQGTGLDNINVLQVDLSTTPELTRLDARLPVFVFSAENLADIHDWLSRFSGMITKESPNSLFFWLRPQSLEPFELLAMNSLPVHLGFYNGMPELLLELHELNDAVASPSELESLDCQQPGMPGDSPLVYEDLNSILRFYGSGTLEL